MDSCFRTWSLQGYLAQKKQPRLLGPPDDPRYSPTVGSWQGGVSCEQGTPCRGMHPDLCIRGPDVIRKEAWPFYRTISGVRLCWELEEPKGPKNVARSLACHCALSTRGPNAHGARPVHSKSSRQLSGSGPVGSSIKSSLCGGKARCCARTRTGAAV